MTDLHTLVIGDVHGRADLLHRMLREAVCNSALFDFDFRVIFLGDIIDRGPHSRQAMQLVTDTIRDYPGSALVRGNHDWFPIRILEELEEDRKELGLAHWLTLMGGNMTVQSYGYDPTEFSLGDLQQMFPPSHLDLLRNASPYIEVDDYILVHAGLIPGVPLSEQKPYDLMWIREPFLTSGGLLSRPVIHGHTITQSLLPEIHGDRIALDTGAYDSDRLSAAHIYPDGSLEFLVSTDKGVEEVEPRKTGAYQGLSERLRPAFIS